MMWCCGGAPWFLCPKGGHPSSWGSIGGQGARGGGLKRTGVRVVTHGQCCCCLPQCLTPLTGSSSTHQIFAGSPCDHSATPGALVAYIYMLIMSKALYLQCLTPLPGSSIMHQLFAC